MSLPPWSRPADEILAELDALKQHDVKWKDGRAFTLAYYAGPNVTALGDEAYRRFSSDNALNTDAFPSLRKIQSDVVAMVAALLDGGPFSLETDRSVVHGTPDSYTTSTSVRARCCAEAERGTAEQG